MNDEAKEINRKDAKGAKMSQSEPSPREKEVSREIVDAAIKVHRTLRPGLLESVYEKCLKWELEQRGIVVQRQISVPVIYGPLQFDSGLCLDLLVDASVIAELKSVEQMIPFYEAQLLTYLKLSGNILGLLINFSVPLLKHGIKRFVLS